MAFSFTRETEQQISKILTRYPEDKKRSGLIPILHIVQAQNSGYLSEEAMSAVAEYLGLEPIEVFEVATFYTMFNLKPVGKYVLEVCQTGPCMLRGSDKIIDYIKQKLNIEIGQTTTDGLFSLKVVECLGACGYAPMMQIGKRYAEFLTEEKIDQIIEDLRLGKSLDAN